MENLKKLTQLLSALNGTSGDEKLVAQAIISRLPSDVSYTLDPLGSLIVEKKGKRVPKNKIMIAAHMDEVGFIVTHITDDGFLKFAPVGGVIPAVVFGRQLRFQNGTRGAVGGKAMHQLTESERDAQPKITDLYIDIGATSREDAEKLVSLGDFAYFTGEQLDFGDGFLAGKALDDRAGCAVMLDMINKELEFDCTFVFTVQEEIGTRGAAAAAYSVNPDMAIVLETTTACDIAGVSGEKQVCRLGSGAVVSYMDNGTLYDRELYRMAFAAAAENGISCQTKTAVAGGNDSAAIHKSAGGVRTLAISAPCRCLHSAYCILKEDDLYAVRRLAEIMLKTMGEPG